jgi:nucleotide-binding universal stress UspA family protein
MFRRILTCLKPVPENAPCRSFAVSFAAKYGSHLTGLYVRSHPPAPVPLATPFAGFVLGEPLAYAPGVMAEVDERRLQHEIEEDRREQAAFSSFISLAFGEGVAAEVRRRLGNVDDEIVRSSQAMDLICLGRGHAREDSVLGSVAGNIVRQTRRPVLLAPHEAARDIERIAVAYDGSAGADRALAAAADIAVNWKGGQPELIVIGVTQSDMDPGAFLEPALKYLEAYGLTCRTSTAPGDPATLINALALQARADLLCIGAYGHSILREIVLGSATQEVIAHWRGALLLCH